MEVLDYLTSWPGYFISFSGLIYSYLMIKQGNDLSKKIAIAKLYVDKGMDEDSALRKSGVTDVEYNCPFWKVW